MKKLFNTHYLLFFVLLGLGLISGCGGDDPEPTAVTVQNFSATIAENPTQGTVLGSLSATTNRGTLSYALTSENPSGAFTLNATTGQLTVADASVFDFEARSTVTATATATADGVSKTASITITLTDVQEITITANNFGLTVNEHPADGTALGTVSATTNQGRLAFELVAEEPSGALSIDQSTGVVTVLDSKLLNYELHPSVTATYRAVNGNVFADAEITITLTDVTETVQKRLDDGELPSQIVGSGISVDSLYGKTFEGGAIAVYYTTVGSEGNCLIMYAQRIGTGQNQSQASALAQNLVAGGKSDWRLPTETERIAFCANFTNDNKSSFPPFSPNATFYWTGTNCGGICFHSFALQTGGVCSSGGSPSSNLLDVLAVRVYNQPR